MDQSKFITGIFSVYDSAQARDFKDCDRFPIGFEAIFRNDAIGQEFAANIQAAMERLPPEKGMMYSIDGTAGDSARGADCFFSDVDTFRRVLNEALPRIGIFHEEMGVLPKMMLIEEAKGVVTDMALQM